MGDGNAAFGGGGHVDVLEPCAKGTNEFELRQRLHLCRRESGRAVGEHQTCRGDGSAIGGIGGIRQRTRIHVVQSHAGGQQLRACLRGQCDEIEHQGSVVHGCLIRWSIAA